VANVARFQSNFFTFTFHLTYEIQNIQKLLSINLPKNNKSSIKGGEKSLEKLDDASKILGIGVTALSFI